MSVLSSIQANPKLKKIAHFLLIPTNDFKPRLWVRLFLNPFKHSKGAGSVIRRRSRLDVFPFNGFALGKKSFIEDFAVINNGVGDVTIGDNTIIGLSNVIIGPVSIGDNVMLAQNIVVSGLNHGYQDVSIPPSLQEVECKKISISDDVWIGANCVITAGVSIGKHSIIGAGSVVTKCVPDYCIAVGNPARIIKRFNFTTREWERVQC
jgi:acetyltransferase-like isoleucine patch superfamily enzyme